MIGTSSRHSPSPTSGKGTLCSPAGEPLGMILRFWDELTANIDATLMLLAVLLITLGLFTLYSASYDTPARLSGQLLNIGVAVAAMWLAAQVPPQTLMRFALPIYLAGLALLVAVALFGDVANGARRWLHIGVVRFQPSEMMKIAMPMMLAWYFQKRETTLACPTTSPPPCSCSSRRC